MRIFLSYKYTGVSLSEHQQTLFPLITVLRKKGYSVFCNIERDNVYTQENWTPKQIMAECLAEVGKSDYCVVEITYRSGQGQQQ